MVQLVKTREVVRLDRLFEVNIEAYVRASKIRLGRGRVRFLVVRAQEMAIRLENGGHIELEMPEDDGDVWRPAAYGGRYLTRVEPYLSRAVFLDDHGMERYVRENVRFSIVASNLPDHHTLVEIDPQKGWNA